MRKIDSKELVFITGPIGVGKSTFLRSLLLSQNLDNHEFINTDLYYYMYFQDNQEFLKYNYKKAKEYCIYKLKKVIDNADSFVWEDVFTKNEKIEILKQCRRKNYKVSGYFIGINSYITLLKRVNLRSFNGWYDVPKEKVISRYNAIMHNFNLLSQLSTDFFAFDSIENEYKLVYAKSNNDVKYISDYCSWLADCLNIKT
ncbi:MAG: hypothetical protein HFJ06_07895 [Lachnospiraceae bacterium]|nr:hypothetical protein [Lachnospiraceae bacterium]